MLRVTGLNHIQQKNASIIIDAALRLAQTKNLSDITVEEICNEASISRGTFYNTFSGRENMISFLFSNMTLYYEEKASALMSADSDFERLMLVYSIVIDYMKKMGSQMFHEYVRIMLSQNEIQPFKLFNRIQDWLLPLIKKCQATGHIRNGSKAEDLLLASINSAYYQAIVWSCSGDDYRIKEMFFPIIETILDIDPQYRGQYNNF